MRGRITDSYICMVWTPCYKSFLHALKYLSENEKKKIKMQAIITIMQTTVLSKKHLWSA